MSVPINSPIKDKIINVLGNSRLVVDDELSILSYAYSASGKIIKPLMIVLPESDEQIKSLIALANQEKVYLYPLSTGKNWGYGTKLGTDKDQIIVDLAKMNKIIEVNTDLHYIKLQPGVTQGQLYDYIQNKAKYHDIQLDVTGAGSEAGIVGNILERGFGHTDYGNRYENILGLKVILADGSIIRTGFHQFYDKAKAGDVYPQGIGPSTIGLFSQSNFGIVTEMTLKLMPKPKKFSVMVGSIAKKNQIGELVEVIKKLKLTGILNSTVHIGNKSRVVGNMKTNRVGEWVFSASLSSYHEIVKAKKSIVKKEFKKSNLEYKLKNINDKTLTLLTWFHSKIKPIGLLPVWQYIVDLQKGKPTNDPLSVLVDDNTIDFKNIRTENFKLHFKWISAVSSAEKDNVALLLESIESVFNKYEYEFRVTLTFINPRAIIAIANITYPKDEKSNEKATAFYKECTASLKEKGFPPYRGGSGLYDDLLQKESYLQNIKKAIDPNGIIAPKKYGLG